MRLDCLLLQRQGASPLPSAGCRWGSATRPWSAASTACAARRCMASSRCRWYPPPVPSFRRRSQRHLARRGGGLPAAGAGAAASAAPQAPAWSVEPRCSATAKAPTPGTCPRRIPKASGAARVDAARRWRRAASTRPQIDFTCAHGTATRANDEIEAVAVNAVLGAGRRRHFAEGNDRPHPRCRRCIVGGHRRAGDRGGLRPGDDEHPVRSTKPAR